MPSRGAPANVPSYGVWPRRTPSRTTVASDGSVITCTASAPDGAAGNGVTVFAGDGVVVFAADAEADADPDADADADADPVAAAAAAGAESPPLPAIIIAST